jgi:putative transposase
LDLPRSSFYYEPEGESELNFLLMRLIDEEFMRHPFYGARRMKAWLWTQAYEVNRKRVSRLMRLMGLAAIYPKPRLSWNGSDHKVYPYLLNGLTINAPDQAWCTDITYIRLAHGFVYLVAVMDWNSVNDKDFSYPRGKDISHRHGKDISHPCGKQISHPPSE